VYFVTFRLAGSVPQEKIRQWRARRMDHVAECEKSEEAQNYVQRQVERWLDQGIGPCHLERPEAAKIVEKSLRHFDGDRYLLDDFVVMPNHVHVIVYPLADHELGAIAKSWKWYTARNINLLFGRTGTFWQVEPFDHIVRDQGHLERFRIYIRNNPSRVPGRHTLGGRGKFKEVAGC